MSTYPDYTLVVATLNRINDPVLLVDSAGFVVYMNPAFSKLSMFRETDVPFRLSRLIEPKYQGEHAQNVAGTFYDMRARQMGELYDTKIKLVQSTGNAIPVSIGLSPLKLSKDGTNFKYVLASVKDESKYAELEHDLEEVRQTAKTKVDPSAVRNASIKVSAQLLGFTLFLTAGVQALTVFGVDATPFTELTTQIGLFLAGVLVTALKDVVAPK